MRLETGGEWSTVRSEGAIGGRGFLTVVLGASQLFVGAGRILSVQRMCGKDAAERSM
jgi:hypothetical protein